MKILLIRPKLYSLIHQSRETEKISEENVRQIEDGRQLENARNDGNDRKVEKGRPLTLIVVLGMLICCLAWTLTVWFSGVCGGAAKDASVKIEQSLQCSTVPSEFRFDCYPNDGVDQSKCEARGCCWNPTHDDDETASGNGRNESDNNFKIGIPFCFYPTGFESYSLVSNSSLRYRGGLTRFYKRVRDSGYPNDIDIVKVEVTFQQKHRIGVKISDAVQSRFEVPYLPEPSADVDLDEDDIDYDVIWSSESTRFGFRIVRKSTKEILFDTAGGFIFSDQFLQLSTLLPSHFIYGLGENRSPFLKSTEWSQHSLWSADQWPALGSTNLYGSHPFYLSVDASGNAHGVFLKNSHAIEVILQPTPAVTFRALGGVLDFYIFTGPSPTSVIEQYSEVIGKPFLPPYWSLGYHQCKFGYKSLARTKQILEQTQKAGIPIDVQWNDIDYMSENKDFTVDSKMFAGLKEFVTDLHKGGLHYIPIIDPGISGSEAPGTYPPFDEGLAMNIFIRNSSDQPFIGKVWNRVSTVWPDFTHPNATKYWTDMIGSFHDKVPIDGAWIDMNEPSNFLDGQIDGCPKTGPDGRLNNPPYVPRAVQGGTLFYHTVCPSARQSGGSHYNLHNMYGFTEAIATNAALTQVRKSRPFIVSRSTFPGQGHYGAHWTGDVLSDWESMRQSIADILNFNMFGMPMVGADICGFNGNTTASLCNRWVQLGAFYPFSRNHNTDDGIDQDPVSLGPDVVRSAKNALEIRYSLLPYLYTLMVRSHLHGTPVARSTFFEFPNDRNTYFLDEQFMWGEALLIVPVLDEGATEVTAYLPEAVWYVLENGTRIDSGGEFYALDAPIDKIPLLARGGTIIVNQGIATTTTKSRLKPFSIAVYLDKFGRAAGEVYVDDGDSLQTYEDGKFTNIRFVAAGPSKKKKMGRFRSSVVRNGYQIAQPVMDVVIHGLKNAETIKNVTFNGSSVKFYTDAKTQTLVVQNLNADLTKALNILWN